MTSPAGHRAIGTPRTHTSTERVAGPYLRGGEKFFWDFGACGRRAGEGTGARRAVR